MNTNIKIFGTYNDINGISEQAQKLSQCITEINKYNINIIDIKTNELISKYEKITHKDENFYENGNKNYCKQINIFSSTLSQIASFVMQFGTETLENSYNIFHIAWEFESRPQRWDSITKLADEIWVISSFLKNGFSEIHEKVKVFPNAIDESDFKHLKSDFISESGVKLCFSFDFNSDVNRKNIVNLIGLFNQIVRPHIFLILKSNNLINNSSLDAQKILQLIKKNKNIIHISEKLSKNEILSLYNSCDVFVSLHRSEGFGIGILEALIIGLEVVTTNYSGNLDFCNSANSHLIPYKLIEVNSNIYKEKNLFWAEPDYEVAKNILNQIIDKHNTSNLTKKINLVLIKKYSVNNLKNMMKNYIEEICEK